MEKSSRHLYIKAFISLKNSFNKNNLNDVCVHRDVDSGHSVGNNDVVAADAVVGMEVEDFCVVGEMASKRRPFAANHCFLFDLNNQISNAITTISLLLGQK